MEKIINFKTKNKIIWGLKRINNQIVKKKYLFDYKDEDIHMSIEKKLFPKKQFLRTLLYMYT